MPAPPLTPAEIRSYFSGSIPPVRVTAGYRARLFAVLLGLVALQILYLLLIAVVLLLSGLYSYRVLGAGLPFNIISVVFYVGPPAGGVIAALFLLKPIVIRPPRPARPIQLTPQSDPLLFEFVDSLCRALGSPRPSRIQANLQVNASAGVQGWRGFFLGHLDLTIGLPLATGLTLPQFAGVLAHEFGHFAQRAGLRSYFLIQTIQGWFARVVYQRDSWDAWLQRQCNARDWRIKGVAHLAAAVVAGSRRYLAFLMKCGGWLSSAFSRQMEFDADRYESALVGAAVFEETALRLPALVCGASLSWQDVQKDWSVGRLPENVPALISTRTAHLTAESAQAITTHELSRTTGRLDTHPCTAERIAAVSREARAGIFQGEGLADRLFRDMPALCAEATRHHYEKILGLPVASAQFVSTIDLIVNAEAAREFEGAAQQLFHLPVEFCSRWFVLPASEPRELESQSSESADFRPELEIASYDLSVETSLLQFSALAIKGAGIAVKAASFRLPSADLAGIRAQEELSACRLKDMVDALNQRARFLAERIETTTARLLSGALGFVIQQDRPLPIPDLDAAWRCYGALSQSYDDTMEIRRHFHAAQIVRNNARVFPAAISANLLDELEEHALAAIGRIAARASGIPASVILDPAAAQTLAAQPAPRGTDAFVCHFEYDGP
ncbi:MAG: M48 family metalloprotease [Bryobacteraceae bacterium]|jgi:Zn-dependent protease with chaperone function